MKLDFIKQIMSEFDQSNVTKMKVEIDDLKIELEKESEKVEYVKPLEKENKYQRVYRYTCKITNCRCFLWCKFT